MALIGDVDDAECFLFIGMDPAQSKFVWMETVTDGWNRVLEAQRKGADLIVVDPRRSATAERADTHVAIMPGPDWAFLLALLPVIIAERLECTATAVQFGRWAGRGRVCPDGELQGGAGALNKK